MVFVTGRGAGVLVSGKLQAAEWCGQVKAPWGPARFAESWRGKLKVYLSRLLSRSACWRAVLWMLTNAKILANCREGPPNH